jgi:hypothetical protein
MPPNALVSILIFVSESSDRRRILKSRCLRRHHQQQQQQQHNEQPHQHPYRRRSPSVAVPGAARVEVATVRPSLSAWRIDKNLSIDNDDDCDEMATAERGGASTCWFRTDVRQLPHGPCPHRLAGSRCSFGGSAVCGRRSIMSPSTPTAGRDLNDDGININDDYCAVFSTSSSAAAAGSTTPGQLKPLTCDFVFDCVDGRFVRSSPVNPVPLCFGRSVTSPSGCVAGTPLNEQQREGTDGGILSIQRYPALDCSVSDFDRIASCERSRTSGCVSSGDVRTKCVKS